MKKLLTLFTALLFVGSMWGNVISVAIDDGTDSDYASTHSWTNATQYDQVVLDANITANRIGTGNNGKYYTDWRFYTNGSNSGSFSIDAANGCTLDSVTFTYTVSNSGALYQGSTQLNSGTKYKISGSSVTYQVKNTNSSTNGQVRLTAIRVVYTVPSTDPSVTLDPTSINLGNVALGASVATQEITVLGENLTSALTATSSNTDVFTVAVKAGDSLTPDGDGNVSATLVITPITTAYGSFDEGIIISDGGLETDSLVPISMHVGGIVTVTPASPDLAFGNVPQNATAADYAKTITVSATHLTANKQIRIICPSNFQSDPIDIYADANGVIEATEVKLMPITDREAGNYGSADAKYYVACTGTTEFASIAIGAPTMTIIACTTLDKPSNVTVSNKVYPYNAVKLEWDEVENADSYEVYIYQGETLIAADEVNTEAYTIGETLAAATTYSYQIIAKSEDAAYCESAVTSDDFTTDDYPTAVLTLSENGATRTWGLGLKLNSEIALPTAVAAGNEVDGKVLVGWSADADRATAPELAKGANYTMNATAVTLYAVYATETPGTPVTHTLTANSNWSGYAEGTQDDNQGATWSYYASGSKSGDVYYFGLNSSSNNYNIGSPTFPGNVQSISAYVKNGSSKNTRYVYICSSDETAQPASGDLGSASIPASNDEEVSMSISGTFKKFYIYVNDALSFKYIEVVVAGTPSYSDYTTTGVKAPSAIVDPEEVEVSAAAVVGGLIDVTYENVNLANVTVALFNDAACTDAFDGGWLTASLDANKDIVYGAEAAVSYANARTAYIKLTAPASVLGPEPAVVVIPVEQAKKPAVFANLEELVASDVPNGDSVTITLTNVQIKNFYIYNANRAGVTFDVQKDNADIRIFKNDQTTIVDWAVGGTLSGTFRAKWSTYSNEWQLSPAYTWAWANLTYNAPDPTALEDVETSAKAVKVMRNGVLYIEKNGVRYNAMGQIIK